MQRAGILAILLVSSVTLLQAQRGFVATDIVPRLSHSLAPHAVAGAAATLPETVRVLAIMVEFKEDSDNRTSGTGKFGTIYEYDYGTEILDPMPHDRSYFAHHLKFLENYVRKVSGRRTFLQGEVLDGIVTVDGPISDYSFLKNESEAPVATLAVEAWEKAVQQFPGTDFSTYDMFVIFHAGRGRDIDLVSIQGYDATPYDIPSLSFTLPGFKRLLGNDFQGIAAGGDFRITNCAILPTTNNREISNIDGSRSLLELSINGLLAASFGTFAGLPDLFDTKTGKTGIGRFGLMDGEGIFAYGGICPPAPSAWEKQRLGWTSPRIASPGTKNYLITAGDSLSTADVIRVPMNNIEYWLVENRQRDLGGNGQLVTLVSGSQIQQLRFPKDTLGFDNSNVSQLKGVVIDVEDIDWSLPGGRVIVDNNEARINGGLLIWHIDETGLEDRIALNTVNVTVDGAADRVVDLEQAGGPQDIGIDIQTVFGTETGTGSPIDYWTRDNISPVYTNRFSEKTSPNTRANSGALSHVTMQKFSTSGPIMSLDINLGDEGFAPVEGFPVDFSALLKSGQRLEHVRSADFDDDGLDEIVAAARSTQHGFALFAARMDGSSFLPSGYLVATARPTGVISIQAPAVGDINGDGIPEVAVILASGNEREVIVYTAADTDTDGSFDIMMHRQFYPGADGRPTLLTALPQIVHVTLVLYVHGGSSVSLIVIGSSIQTYAVGQHDFLAYNDVQVLPLDETGMLYVHSLTGGFAASLAGAIQPMNFTSVLTAPIAAIGMFSGAADMDGDGHRELVMTREISGMGTSPRLMIASYALGSEQDAEPRHLTDALPGDGGSNSVTSLAFADLDYDGRSELLLAHRGGRLTAVNQSGASIDNFPKDIAGDLALTCQGASLGNVVITTGASTVNITGQQEQNMPGYPAAFPSSEDALLIRTERGRLGIVAVSESELYLFETSSTIDVDNLIWSTRYGNSGNSLRAPLPKTLVSDQAEFFPASRCYNWPNPVYDGSTRIRFFVSEDADVTVKIYDLAGDKVDELHSRALGGIDNEIAWDVSGIESDIYLAKVEAQSADKKGEKIIKIAVVR